MNWIIFAITLYNMVGDRFTCNNCLHSQRVRHWYNPKTQHSLLICTIFTNCTWLWKTIRQHICTIFKSSISNQLMNVDRLTARNPNCLIAGSFFSRIRRRAAYHCIKRGNAGSFSKVQSQCTQTLMSVDRLTACNPNCNPHNSYLANES